MARPLSGGSVVISRLECRCPHTRLPRRLRASAARLRRDVEVRQLRGPGTAFRRDRDDVRGCLLITRRVYGDVVSWSRWSWAALARPAAASDDLPLPDLGRRHAGRERAVDALAFLLAAGLGALFLSPELHDTPDPLSATQVAVDVSAGVLACVSLWWRRRWPVGVALACLLLGTVSTSATPAGLLALSSLAVHRPARPTVVVTVLWVPSLLAFAVYSPTTGPVSVVLFVMPLALAASGWGMFLRARRLVLLSLRERALRAEADQELREEQAWVAERTVPTSSSWTSGCHGWTGSPRPRRCAGSTRHRRSSCSPPSRPTSTWSPPYAPAPAGSWSRTPHPPTSFNAVRLVAAGDTIISPSVTRTLLPHFGNTEASERHLLAAHRLAALTDRERDVATAVDAGASNAEIAATHFMSEATVKAHVSRLLSKLDASNRVQIAILVHDAAQT